MDILGIGYLGFEALNPSAWRSYGPDILGMELADSPPGDPETVYLRMDDRRHRLAISPGEADGLRYIGWELINRTAYRDALARLAAAGVEVEVGDRTLTALRGVREVARFSDPAGYQHEIFYGQEWMPETFRSGRPGFQGFNCGPAGVGHAVLLCPEPIEEQEAFFMNVMGFEWFGNGSGNLSMAFLRPKLSVHSHCIALAHVPHHFGLQHIALAMKSLDDVGVTQDLVLASDLQMQMTLGRHTNDPVISFYHFTPTNFIVECLWGEMDWKDHNIGFEANPPKLSKWGHKVVGPMIGSSIRRLAPLDKAAEQAPELLERSGA